MAVKKVEKKPTTKPAAKPTAKKPAAKATPAPAPTPEAKAKPAKANKTPDQARAEMLKPSLEALRKQEAETRSEQLKETGLVVIDPTDAKVPLGTEVKPATIAGLVEVPVEGTSITLLGLAKPNATPTLEQRVAIAKRLIEVSDKLPKYVKTIVAKQPDLANAEKAAAAPKPAEKTTEKKAEKPSVPNGVPLKKICAEIDVDPKLARRVLRAGGSKPGGRWEWPQAEVEGVKKTIKAGVEKLKAAKEAAK